MDLPKAFGIIINEIPWQPVISYISNRKLRVEQTDEHTESLILQSGRQ